MTKDVWKEAGLTEAQALQIIENLPDIIGMKIERYSATEMDQLKEHDPTVRLERYFCFMFSSSWIRAIEYGNTIGEAVFRAAIDWNERHGSTICRIDIPSRHADNDE